MFPRVFARLNANGVPGAGLIIVAVLMTIVLFATMSPTLADQFGRIVDLAVILIIVPYVYSAVAVVKVIYDHKLPRKTFLLYKWIALAAVAYCLWAVIGGDPDTVVHAMVALLISVPLYPFFIRSMEAAAKRNASSRSAPLDPQHDAAGAGAARDALVHEDHDMQRRAPRIAQSLALRCISARAAGSGARTKSKADPPPGLPAGFDWTFNFDATCGRVRLRAILSTRIRSPSSRPAI